MSFTLGISPPPPDEISRLTFAVATQATWEQQDPRALLGELMFELQPDGSFRAKIGDGQRRYTELPYFSPTAPGNNLTAEQVTAIAIANAYATALILA